jgi:RNA polymerase sigma factor (sigma-70 family)
MGKGRLGQALRHLRRLASGGPAADCPDRQLLRRYTEQRDEAAFAALVERHGPLVLGVCRAVLGHAQDAEDAFQAAFLVLAQKAGSIRNSDSVGSWLYGVAHRTALRARRDMVRRGQRESKAAERSPEQPPSEAALRELQAILHEEVQRLPQRERAPFVLCCLENRSREEAARELGWKEGTVSCRVARARERLRQRLARRGVDLSAVLCAVAVAQGSTDAGTPAALAAAAVRGALGGAGGTAPARVVTLAKDVGKGMAMSKVKTGLALALALGLLVSGIGLAAHQATTAPAPQGDGQKPAAAAPGPEKAPMKMPKGLDRNGDPLPKGAVARLGTVRFHHGFHAAAVAFAPDGKTLAAGGFSVVSLWDAATGKELDRFRAEGDASAWLDSVTFSPDSRLVAWGTADKVILHERATGKQRQLTGHKNVIHVVKFSRDGKRLASSSGDRTARLWDVTAGHELRRFEGHGGEVRGLDLSADGKRLVTGGDDKTIRLWDAESGKELQQFLGHTQELYAVAFSPDGQLLASGAGDQTVRVWEVATGKQSRHFQGRQTVRSVIFSPNGKLFAASDMDGVLRLFETATGGLVHEMRQADAASGIAFSPDGTVLASAGSENGGIYRWDVATGKELRQEPGHRGRVDRVAVSPDGKLIASAGREAGIRLWSAATGEELGQLPTKEGRFLSLAFSPDGKALSSSAAEWVIRLWDPVRREALRTLDVKGVALNLAFAPDGRTLAGSDSKGVTLWDSQTGKVLRRLDSDSSPKQLEDRLGSYPALAVASRGRLLASVGPDAVIYLWDPLTGKRLRSLPKSQGEIYSLALTPDGEFLVSTGGRVRGKASNYTFCLWRTATGELVRSWQADGFYAPAFALSPDGKSLAVTEALSLHVLELATGRQRASFSGHRGPIRSIAFAPDGRTAVTASEDSTLLIWDLSGAAAEKTRP